jgi:hypothetical protein
VLLLPAASASAAAAAAGVRRAWPSST